MKVLIVDDEPLALSELRFLLDKQSNVDQVVEADGVTAAKQQLAKEAPDMMFLDIRLEDGNGMAFAKQLKERPDCPYIVFATAYDQYALDAFEAQAVDYVMKRSTGSKNCLTGLPGRPGAARLVSKMQTRGFR